MYAQIETSTSGELHLTSPLKRGDRLGLKLPETFKEPCPPYFHLHLSSELSSLSTNGTNKTY